MREARIFIFQKEHNLFQVSVNFVENQAVTNVEKSQKAG
jgi:hypothetical protein